MTLVRLSVPVLLATAIALSGCSQIKSLTGQKDNTVLQGERETILNPDQTRIQNPDVKQQSRTSQAPEPLPDDDVVSEPLEKDLAAPCDPEIDSNCNAEPPPSTAGDGVFSDGQ
jgi:hypothetical protein